MNIDKNKKYMSNRSDKIVLFPDSHIFDFHADLYNDNITKISKMFPQSTIDEYIESISNKPKEFFFTYNGKQYMYNFISMEELKSMLDVVEKFKENLMLELVDCGEDGLRLRYFYILKEYDILINCEVETNEYGYQKTYFEVESTGYKGFSHGNILLEFDEGKRNKLLKIKRLIKHFTNKMNNIRGSLLTSLKQNEFHKSGRINLYGGKDNVLLKSNNN